MLCVYVLSCQTHFIVTILSKFTIYFLEFVEISKKENRLVEYDNYNSDMTSQKYLLNILKRICNISVKNYKDIYYMKDIKCTYSNARF